MNRYRVIFYLTVFAFLSIKAQINTYSPYSYFGLGEIYNYSNTSSASMCGFGVTTTNSNLSNYINPATYSYLKQTVFEIGGRSSYRMMYQDDLEQRNFITGLLNLGLAFPISKKIGISVGLLPYSSVGYNVTSEVFTNDDIGNVNYTYSGSGGLNRFLFGTGWRITDDISIGVNWNYLFGSIDKVIDISTEDIFTQFREEQSTYISDFNFDFGALYSHTLNGYDINIGVTMSPKRGLNSINRVFQNTYYSSGNYETLIDTILDVSVDNNDIIMPFNSSVGLSIGLESKWLIGVDYKYTNWEEYSNHNSTYSYMRDRNEIIFGGKFTPKKNDIHNYFNQIEYRMGFSYGVGYLDLAEAVNLGDSYQSELQNHLMEDISISIGMGLPINKMSSMANVGLKYGTRINIEENIINEEYLTIYFSMTLNEKWFKKRKIE